MFAPLQKYGVLKHEEVPSRLVTFYTTLLSLSQIALRLDSTASLLNSSCNNSDTETANASNSSSTAGLEMRALSAVVSQVVTDACNYVSYN